MPSKRPRCRAHYRDGRPCHKPVAVGNQYTCTNHQSREQILANPPGCLCGCLLPIPPGKSVNAFFATPTCKQRYDHKKQISKRPNGVEGMRRTGRCPRCNCATTYYHDSNGAYTCVTCGYLSDRTDLGPGVITTPSHRVSKELLTESKEAAWRRELTAHPPKEGAQYAQEGAVSGWQAHIVPKRGNSRPGG